MNKKNLIFLTILISVLMVSVISAQITGNVESEADSRCGNACPGLNCPEDCLKVNYQADSRCAGACPGLNCPESCFKESKVSATSGLRTATSSRIQTSSARKASATPRGWTAVEAADPNVELVIYKAQVKEDQKEKQKEYNLVKGLLHKKENVL